MKPEITMLVLLEREHDRLKNQLTLLATCDVDIDDLIKLQSKWKEELCFALCAPPLLSALSALIKQREYDAYPTNAYHELIYQIHVYKRASWDMLHQAFGNSLSPYLNEWGHLRKQYRRLYKNRMEPNKKLPIALQADYLRNQLHNLLPQPTTTVSPEAFIQTAQQQVNETLLKTLLAQITKMKQLVEETHQTKQSPLSDAMTLEVTCTST
jgi:hypothetical protein